MSGRDDIDELGPGERDAALAGEYALRLLDAAEERACAAREASDPAFAAEVARWRADLAGLDADFAPAAPPAALRARLLERLFPEAEAERPSALARLWDSVGLWRGLAAGAAAVAVWFAVAPAPEPGLVAALAPREGQGEFVASYDAASGTISITRLAGDLAPDQDFQLWALIDAAPVSLGLLPDAPRADIVLPPELAARMGAGTLVEVSREPEGGSPDPGPSGDVMAAGFLRDV